VIPIIFSLLGLIFFCASAFVCYAFEMKQDKEYRDYEYPEYSDCGSDLKWVPPIPITDRSHFGFWSLELMKYEGVLLNPDFSVDISITKECKPWDEIEACYDIDAPLKAGRAIGIIGTVLAAMTFLFISSASFVNYPKILLPVAGAITIFVAIVAPVLFVGLATEFCSLVGFSCKPDTAAYMAIPSSVCLMIAGLSMFFIKKRVLMDDLPQQAESARHPDRPQDPENPQVPESPQNPEYVSGPPEAVIVEVMPSPEAVASASTSAKRDPE